MEFLPVLVIAGVGIGIAMLFGGGDSSQGQQKPAPKQIQASPPPIRRASPKPIHTASPPPVLFDPPEGVPQDAPGLLDSLYKMGQDFYDWLVSPSRPTGRIDDVMRAFDESKDVPYSYGGGHPPAVASWPEGSAGRRGGIGWDCSSWVPAVMRRSPEPPAWASTDLGATGIWKRMGRPTNGKNGVKPGDVVFFGNSKGEIKHIAFATGDDMAVSAFGAGSGTNADKPNQKVKAHTFDGTGLLVIGTASW